MNFDDYLDSLIPILAALKIDPVAKVFYDLMTDALIWADERPPFDLTAEQMGCLRAIFRFRTSLITSTPDTRFYNLWDTLKAKCPQWIGFTPSRCSPTAQLIETYQKLKGR